MINDAGPDISDKIAIASSCVSTCGTRRRGFGRRKSSFPSSTSRHW
jgi:hypothetical protein